MTLHALTGTFERGELYLEGVTHPDAVAEVPTDPQGFFEIAAPEVGMWAVRVAAPGRAPAEYRVQPLLDDVQLPTVDLEAATELVVDVRDGDGAALQARILAYRVMAGPRFMGRRSPDYRDGRWNLPLVVDRTGQNGRLKIPVEDGGEYFVRVTAPGFVPAERELKDVSKARIELAAGRERRVRAVDSRDRGSAGALVYLRDSQLPLAVTGDDGRVTLFQGAEPLHLVITDREGRRGEGTLTVAGKEDEEPEEVAVTLDEPQRYSGRVIDYETRQSVGNALVWLAGRSGDFTRSDGSGSFVLHGASQWRAMWAVAPGYARVWGDLRRGAKGAAADDGDTRVPTLALMPAAVVSGRVVDPDGEGVSGVEIVTSQKQDRSNPARMMRMLRSRFEDKTARTTRQGRFRVSGLPVGSDYELKFRRDGFAEAQHTVEKLRPFEQRSDVHVVLDRGRRGFGQVVDPDDEGVAGATVRLTLRPEDAGGRMNRIIVSFGDDEAGGATEYLTDAEGRFDIPDLASGKYDLAVEASGFGRAAIPGIEVPREVSEVDLGTVMVVPGVPIEGRVTDAEGQPLPAAEIRVGKDTGMPANFLSFQLARERPRARTNAKGEFAVSDLREGEKVHLLVKHAGFIDATVAGVVAPTVEPLSVEMKPASKVIGRVLDDEGRPVAEAMIVVDAEGERAFGARGQSRADGTFEVEDVAPGRKTVSAQANGYQEYRIGGLEVTEGTDLTGVELTVTRGATIEGTVFAPDGRPVIGATVRAVEPGSSNRFSFSGLNMSDGDGRYWIDGLPLERRTVIAEHDVYQRVARDLEIEKGVNTLDLVFEGGAEVSGRVIGPQGGPLPDVLVTLRAGGSFFFVGSTPQATSQADGAFTLTGVQPGQYDVLATKEGYASARTPDPVTVGQSPIAGLEIQLTTGATLTGEVRGLTVDELAELQITVAAERDYRVGEVNFEGRYKVPNLGVGEWRVTAELRSAGRRTTGRVTVAEDDLEVSLDLEFGSGYTLTGTVLVGDKPMASVWIFASGKSRASTARATTDQQGRFSLEGLEEDTYNLNVTSSSFSGMRHSEEVEITGDDDILIELVTARVTGWVRDAFDQTPLADVGMSAQAVDSEEGSGVFFFGGRGNVTDSRGYFSLVDVPEGAWKVVAQRTGYGLVEKPIDVQGQTVEEIDIEMSPTEGLFFEVELSVGGAPSSVWAAVLKTPGGGHSDALVSGNMVTGENGRVRMTEVPPGSFELLVSAPGTAAVAMPVVSPGQLGRIVLPIGGILKLSVPELAEETVMATVKLVSASGQPFRRLQYGRILDSEGLRSGKATIPGIAPGAWTVTITANGGRSWTRQANVVTGQTTDMIVE